MLKIPNCEICKHYLEQKKLKKMCCNAFPDGIPLDVIIKAGPGVDCALGYFFLKKRKMTRSIESHRRMDYTAA